LRQLATDQQQVPLEWLNSVIARIQDSASRAVDEVIEAAELLRIASAFFPEFINAPPANAAQPLETPPPAGS
jgi:hypothetical protein